MATNKEYIKWLLDNNFYPKFCQIGFDLPGDEIVRYEIGLNYPLKLEIEVVKIQTVSVVLKFKFPEIGLEFEDRVYQSLKKSPEDFYNKVGEKAFIKIFSLKKGSDDYDKLYSLYITHAGERLEKIRNSLAKIKNK